ncbi:MAG: hypothetical protein AAF658_00865 [Myxococcota bacterium]
MKRSLLLFSFVLFSGALAFAQGGKEPAADEAADDSQEESEEERCEDLPPAEVSFLKALRDRQRELQEREARVAQREEELRKRESEFQRRISNAVKRIEELEAIAEAGKQGREARETRVMTLAKALEGLSAKKAAPMLANVELDLARELMMRLSPKQFGALLTVMDPQRAADLMQEVAQVATPGRRSKRR